MTTTPAIDVDELDAKVQSMYRAVATDPGGRYHFEMGRQLAERLGYPTAMLDRIPAGAIESFAGVGYYFDLAALTSGERVLDLGSGSGMDAFFAARQMENGGYVVGVDMTDEQLVKANRLRDDAGLSTVTFVKGRIEDLPVDTASFDCVMSNGVINLSARKARVFEEAARALKPGGRVAIADIVTEVQLTESIVCNTDLWASCIGGAAQQDSYRGAIEDAGFEIRELRANLQYRFLSRSAQNASQEFGVKSICLLAVKR